MFCLISASLINEILTISLAIISKLSFFLLYQQPWKNSEQRKQWILFTLFTFLLLLFCLIYFWYFISDCITIWTSQFLGLAKKPVLHTYFIAKKMLSRISLIAWNFLKQSTFASFQYISYYLFKQLETTGISAYSHIFSHTATPYGKIISKIWLIASKYGCFGVSLIFSKWKSESKGCMWIMWIPMKAEGISCYNST